MLSARPAVWVTGCICSQEEASSGGDTIGGAETLSSITERAALGRNTSPVSSVKTGDPADFLNGCGSLNSVWFGTQQASYNDSRRPGD